MRRRHSTSICVHDPPCCYTLREPGTDTSSELYLPRAYLKKKRTLPVHNASKYYKRREALPPLKHYHPCVTSHRCSRISYEKPYPTTQVKSRRRIRHFDDASTDARSISEASICTSALSVDVSCEMAAVNKEIETLLTRYERAIDDSIPTEVAYRPKPQGKIRIPAKPQERRMSGRNLSPEQLRVLSMDRPPLEKLDNIPVEYLKPRIPSHIKEKLLQAQKIPGMANKSLEKKTSPRIIKQPPQSKAPSAMNNDLKRSDSAEELLNNMWGDMIAQGLIPKTEEPGKAVKEICESMKFNDDSELKIDLDAMSKLAKSVAPNAKSTGTLTSPSTRTNRSISSIATQTAIDDDSIYKKRPQVPQHGMGDADRSTLYSEGPTTNDIFNNTERKEVAQKSSGDFNLEVQASAVNTDSSNQFPSQSNDKKEVCVDVDNSKLYQTIIPQVQSKFDVYTLQTASKTFESLKKNFDEWLSIKRPKEPIFGHNLTPPSNQEFNSGSNKKLNLNTTNEKDSLPLTCNFTLEVKKQDSEQGADQNLLNAEVLKNLTNQNTTLNGFISPTFNGMTVNQLETSRTHISLLPKLQELNMSKLTNTHSIKSNSESNPDVPKPDRLEEISVYGQAQSEMCILGKYQSANKSNSHVPCMQKSQVLVSPNIASLQKQRTIRSSVCNSRNQDRGQRLHSMEPLVECNDEDLSKYRNGVEVIDTSNGKSIADSETSRRQHSSGLISTPNTGSFLQNSGKSSTEDNIEIRKGDATSDIKENHNKLKEPQELKTGFKKENIEDFDSSLCVEIIKKLIDTMMKCEPGKISDEIAPGKGVMYHLKQLRSDHLKHIQTEVKHIEDLDRCLEDFGISTQLLYSSTRSSVQENK